MPDLNPYGLILVSSGSKGDKLLFRYPYRVDNLKETKNRAAARTPYAVKIVEDYLCTGSSDSCTEDGPVGFSDEVLAIQLAVKTTLCGQAFEEKINDVVFAGFPLALESNDAAPRKTPGAQNTTMVSFHVVFALPTHATSDIIHSYQKLAQEIAVALCKEEKRCFYLTEQANFMLDALENDSSTDHPFQHMIMHCSLCKQLKLIYDDLCLTGIVQCYINSWININFCLPHKVQNMYLPRELCLRTKPNAIHKCLASLRPYHALLFLKDKSPLMNEIPLDGSPAMKQFITCHTPLKSLQALASDTALPLQQIFFLAGQLLYWGKAMVVYPLCESNVYTLSPHANTYINSSLAESFYDKFHGVGLHTLMRQFSMPSSLGDHNVLRLAQQKSQQTQMVVWMLCRRLLIQLHTYILLVIDDEPKTTKCKTPKKEGVVSSKSVPVIRRSCIDTNVDFSINLTPTSPDANLLSSPTNAPGMSGSDVNSVTSEDSLSHQFLSEKSSMDLLSDGEGSSQAVCINGFLSKLSPHMRDTILAVPSASRQEDLQLFARLFSYFNGKHHLEEIMYYENVTRSQLFMLLDKFRDVLITCQHEDPGIVY